KAASGPLKDAVVADNARDHSFAADDHTETAKDHFEASKKAKAAGDDVTASDHHLAGRAHLEAATAHALASAVHMKPGNYPLVPAKIASGNARHKTRMAMDASKTASDNAASKAKPVEDFSKHLKRIARMTDNNDHSGAALAGARMLGHAGLQKEFGDIRAAHLKMGHLGGDLYARRNAAMA